MEAPARQIAANAGYEGGVVVRNILRKRGAYGFDADKGRYGDMIKAGIVDPTKVVRTALQNAASVAGLLITTDACIASKPEPEGEGGQPGGWGGWGGGLGGMGGLMSGATAPAGAGAVEPSPARRRGTVNLNCNPVDGDQPMKIEPLEDRIVVEPLEAEEVTKGGIVLPDTAQEKPQQGKIVAVGPGKVLDSGDRAKPAVKKGDTVVNAKYGGTEPAAGAAGHVRQHGTRIRNARLKYATPDTNGSQARHWR